MALRVLLADESSTIKKVFQLSLQDFAVDVVSVNVGLDVLAVAKKFQPDIVFADVLLQKKSGYDVCAEIKADPELSATPVVLIWSGFMELDDDKFQASGADDQLEKPFEAKQLRAQIQKLVPKTQSQDLSGFLTFPNMPEFSDEDLKPAGFDPNESSPSLELGPDGNSQAIFHSPEPEAPQAVQQAGTNPSLNIGPRPTAPPPLPEEDSADQFERLDLKVEPAPAEPEAQENSNFDDNWLNAEEENTQWSHKTLSHKTLGNFKDDLDHPSEDEAPQVQYVIPEEEISEGDVVLQSEITATGIKAFSDGNTAFPESHDVPLPEPEGPPAFTQSQAATTSTDRHSIDLGTGSDTPVPAAEPQQLSEEQLEGIIRAQSQEMIEAVIWKVVPELAKQIIEREIKKLLEERERKGRMS